MFTKKELEIINNLDGLPESLVLKIDWLLNFGLSKAKYEIVDEDGLTIVRKKDGSVSCVITEEIYDNNIHKMPEYMRVRQAIDKVSCWGQDGFVPYISELYRLQEEVGKNRIIFFYGESFSFDAEDYDDSCIEWIELIQGVTNKQIKKLEDL